MNNIEYYFQKLKPIDDDEFNIPSVDFVPSLESILNDTDDQSMSDDEGGPHYGSGQQISAEGQLKQEQRAQILLVQLCILFKAFLTQEDEECYFSFL